MCGTLICVRTFVVLPLVYCVQRKSFGEVCTKKSLVNQTELQLGGGVVTQLAFALWCCHREEKCKDCSYCLYF